MAELANITIKGFRSIASITELALGPINVLIGPNGSGKSNFVAVFSFLRAIREGRLQDYVATAGRANRLLHFGARVTPEMNISLWFNNPSGTQNGYTIRLTPTDVDELLPYDVCHFWNKDRYPDSPYNVSLTRPGMEAGISVPMPGTPNHVRDHLTRWRVYQFHDTSATSTMRKVADLDDNRFLRSDGSNLPAFLYYLRQKHNAAYNLIRGAVRQAAPFLDDFQLEPRSLDESTISLEWFHKGSDAYFDVSSLSDGTLRFIALATLLQQPQELRPSVILIDEPELGMHPYAITLLASLIKQASTTSQVIVSTQSSLLLDHFEPEDVLVADRVNGATELRRLNSEELGDWLEDYSLGQLWEKNEIGGRPRSE